ncbi:MAG: Crp/Fnr family transcriptional regulator, partial [Candidatus Eisenbacteria bacterium]|nr:Crp/Fnr family transcriptional regulator [Candidatus Eisenbacteria bacterium]
MKGRNISTSASDLLSLIASSRIFGDITEAKSRIIRSGVRKLSLSRGSTLFAQGKPSDAMYLVLSGRLLVYREDGGEAEGAGSLKGQIGPGEPVG